MIYLKKKNYFYKIKNSNKFLNLPFVPVQHRWHLPKKSTIYVLKHFALWHHFDIVKKENAFNCKASNKDLGLFLNESLNIFINN